MRAEPAHVPHFLMCLPHEDSPHASRQKGAKALAAIKEAITGAGGVVVNLNDKSRSLTERDFWNVYTRDPFIVLPQNRILFPRNSNTHSYMAMRQQLKRFFDQASYEHTVTDIPYQLDGGDMLPGHERHFLGSRDDAGRKAAMLEKQLGEPVIPVTLDQANDFYHLDTFMASLPRGEVMLFSLATDKKSEDRIKSSAGKHNVIELDGDDAKQMAANCIPVRDSLIMPACSPKLRAQLTERDYNVITPEDMGLPPGSFSLAEELSGGGAARCATQPFEPRVREHAKTPGQALSRSK